MRLRHCPPSLPSALLMLPHPCLIFSLAYNPYAATGPSGYASDATLTAPYASSHPPNMPLTRLTVLTLAVPSHNASDAPYHPYSLGVAARNASHTTYHPYTCIVPAQHASNPAYHIFARSAL
ncbi:hypothetical protein O181_067195 [Austropuccinia psidii MF-1]|uniref:Uncharacterized protein n=1 Tax=Austropuccinia psidii MF-1 TaxID=1389203 RepID=A0A9Q3EYI1_9BASI|nr:hypothetical protein [Austropuccinia psidii MF-1]